MGSKISWTDETWNPIAGCSKCSPGCPHCYAERMAHRLQYMGNNNPQYLGKTDDKGHWTGKVECCDWLLDKPLRWRKPRRIFVCSMSDLFHKKVPFEFILKIFGLSMVTPWHTYLILTKRIGRVLLFFEWWRQQWRKSRILWGKDALALQAVENLPADLEKANQYWLDNFDQSGRGKLDYPIPCPQPNLWLGVSVCNQQEADEKTLILSQIPAAKRFLSLEPLLGPVDLPLHSGIHWVIVGGESGPGARPMRPDWVRSIRDQCKAAGVPFFFKQWGAWEIANKENAARNGYIVTESRQGFLTPYNKKKFISLNVDGTRYQDNPQPNSTAMARVGKKAAGNLLDGKKYEEYPK